MSGHKAQLSAALAAASVPCPDYEVRDLGDERLTEDQPRYLATVEVPPHRRASGLLQEDGEPEFFMGEGNTVEEAEQDAARVALEMLAPAPAGEAEAAKVQPTGSAPVEPLVPDVEESSDQPRPAAQKPGAVVQDQADGTVKGGSGSRSVQESARELVQLLDALLRDERALASQEHELACYLADVEGPGLGGQQGPGGWLAVPALAQAKSVRQWLATQLEPEQVQDVQLQAHKLHEALVAAELHDSQGKPVPASSPQVQHGGSPAAGSTLLPPAQAQGPLDAVLVETGVSQPQAPTAADELADGQGQALIAAAAPEPAGALGTSKEAGTAPPAVHHQLSFAVRLDGWAIRRVPVVQAFATALDAGGQPGVQGAGGQLMHGLKQQRYSRGEAEGSSGEGLQEGDDDEEEGGVGDVEEGERSVVVGVALAPAGPAPGAGVTATTAAAAVVVVEEPASRAVSTTSPEAAATEPAPLKQAGAPSSTAQPSAFVASGEGQQQGQVQDAEAAAGQQGVGEGPQLGGGDDGGSGLMVTPLMPSPSAWTRANVMGVLIPSNPNLSVREVIIRPGALAIGPATENTLEAGPSVLAALASALLQGASDRGVKQLVSAEGAPETAAAIPAIPVLCPWGQVTARLEEDFSNTHQRQQHEQLPSQQQAHPIVGSNAVDMAPAQMEAVADDRTQVGAKGAAAAAPDVTPAPKTPALGTVASNRSVQAVLVLGSQPSLTSAGGGERDATSPPKQPGPDGGEIEDAAMAGNNGGLAAEKPVGSGALTAGEAAPTTTDITTTTAISPTQPGQDPTHHHHHHHHHHHAHHLPHHQPQLPVAASTAEPRAPTTPGAALASAGVRPREGQVEGGQVGSLLQQVLMSESQSLGAAGRPGSDNGVGGGGGGGGGFTARRVDSTVTVRCHKGPAAMDWAADGVEDVSKPRLVPDAGRCPVGGSNVAVPGRGTGDAAAAGGGAQVAPAVEQPHMYTLMWVDTESQGASSRPQPSAVPQHMLNTRASSIVGGAVVHGDALLSLCRPSPRSQGAPPGMQWGSFPLKAFDSWWSERQTRVKAMGHRRSPLGGKRTLSTSSADGAPGTAAEAQEGPAHKAART